MIPQLAQLIREAVEECLEDRVGVAFSGGLDSTTIAHIAKEHCEVRLFTAGVEGAQDIDYAQKVASLLNLPLTVITIDRSLAVRVYKRLERFLGLGFLQLEILVPIALIAQKAKEAGIETLLFGSGAEELFVGYNRYYTYFEEGKDLDRILKEEFATLPKRDIGWIKKVCRKEGVEARFPFYNKRIADLVFSIPLEERMAEKDLKKGVLREAAKLLKVPSLVIERKKKALQYGSGVHKLLLKAFKNGAAEI